LEMGVFWTICQDWFQTTILLISASWVARLQAWATSAQLHYAYEVLQSHSPYTAFCTSPVPFKLQVWCGTT
jgi:hypothetical protein